MSQCVQEGLVDGRKLFMDSCLVQANASNNSVVNTESLKGHLNKGYQKLQARLDEEEQETEREGAANSTHISTTDKDDSEARRGGGTSKLK